MNAAASTAETFRDLVVTHLHVLYNYALLMTREAGEAEDLLQEALLRAFEHFTAFDPALDFKPWMFAIVKRAYIDRRRRRRTRADTGAAFEAWTAWSCVETLHSRPAAPEDVLLRRETMERVHAAIARLPASFREVVELRDVEGLSYEQIAARTHRPVGTVMSRLYRGRSLLRTYLGAPPRPAASPPARPA